MSMVYDSKAITGMIKIATTLATDKICEKTYVPDTDLQDALPKIGIPLENVEAISADVHEMAHTLHNFGRNILAAARK